MKVNISKNKIKDQEISSSDQLSLSVKKVQQPKISTSKSWSLLQIRRQATQKHLIDSEQA
jgi:hypothetical protein